MKITLKIAAIGAAILLTMVVLVQFYGGSFLAEKLNIHFARLTEDSYTIEYQSLKTTILPPGITIQALTISPRDSLQPKPFLIKDNLLAPNISAAQISVQGISLIDLIFKNKIVVGQLTLDSLVIRANLVNGRDSSEVIRLNGSSEGADMKVEIKQLSLLSNEFFLFEAVSDSSSKEIGHGTISAELQNLSPYLIDGQKEPISDGTVKLTAFRYLTPDGLYKLELDSANLDWAAESLALSGFHLIPQYPKYEFALKKGHQTGRNDVDCKLIMADGLSFSQLINNEQLSITSLRFDSLVGNFYRDKRLGRPENEPAKPLPHESLLSSPLPFNIDSIVISDSRVVYQEFSENGTAEGEISFDRLNATITNIRSNSPEYAVLKARTFLFDQGLLQTEIRIPMNPDSLYHVQGSLAPMKIATFNRILTNVAFISVESGELEELKFNFSHNRTNAWGDISLLYQNLVVSGTQQARDNSDNVFQDIKLWLFNKLVLKRVDKMEAPLVGKISASREMEKSIFAFWWHSLLSGIKQCINPFEKPE
ncbi:hypothetical protein RT717_06275 [Imperialibacter roseus]|uniref:DUF748 domain-containing protein n=1 Tax=Imperialibacter roseus TaxID=1324217 RepID=A0ABZ0IX63_9BACT|nr:hypothetical protein [Imperialibacter roseus]WOK08241.1 hypothetical protein RT717_06275 [Imperialibacter roseus]